MVVIDREEINSGFELVLGLTEGYVEFSEEDVLANL